MRAKGFGLSSVVLLVVVVWLGAYSVRYYTWTAPTQIGPLTYGITTGQFSAPVNTTGSVTYGQHPTATTAAVPASDAATGENATITIGENYFIHFAVTDADAGILDNYFTSLTINIRVYRRGLVGASPISDNNLYVVVGGVGQTNIDNWTVKLDAAYNWDPVITINYTTGATAVTGQNIPIKVYAREP